jgi:hypothetical protein
VASQVRSPQTINQLPQGFFSAPGRRTPHRVPAAFFCNAGNDIAVGTFADHQGGLEVSVFLEVSYCGKEVLMPGTQKNPSTASKIVHPFLLVFDLHFEG